MKFLRWREFHCLAAPRFVFQVACRDDPFIVSRIVQAILFFTGASKRNFGRKEKIKSGDTFWFITLVLSDGFRYRFVNAKLKHQGLIWFEPWCPENLLRTESDRDKVWFGDQIFENFDFSCLDEAGERFGGEIP